MSRAGQTESVSPLDDYLALIERERDRRPAEAMLASEIHRLRAEQGRCSSCAHFIPSWENPDGERSRWGECRLAMGYDARAEHNDDASSNDPFDDADPKKNRAYADGENAKFVVLRVRDDFGCIRYSEATK